MEVLTDKKEFEEKAIKAVEIHGHDAEHNYHHYMNQTTSAKMPIFVGFDNSKGVLAQKSKTGKLWYMISEVLAPKEEKFETFMKFVDHVFNKDEANRLQIEVDKKFRKELKEKLENTDFRSGQLNFRLEWPMYDMKTWDGDKLEGKKWKKIRNIKNRFLEEHKVELIDSLDLPKEELKKIITDWIDKRGAEDFAYKECYFRMVDSDFAGCDMAKTLIVDGIPCSITAGWRVPNTNTYYSGIGVLNYKFEGLGEITNLYDLIEIKKMGFDKANFGGSDDDLLEFKNKFKPVSTYNTYTFSIMRKNKDGI